MEAPTQWDYKNDDFFDKDIEQERKTNKSP